MATTTRSRPRPVLLGRLGEPSKCGLVAAWGLSVAMLVWGKPPQRGMDSCRGAHRVHACECEGETAIARQSASPTRQRPSPSSPTGCEPAGCGRRGGGARSGRHRTRDRRPRRRPPTANVAVSDAAPGVGTAEVAARPGSLLLRSLAGRAVMTRPQRSVLASHSSDKAGVVRAKARAPRPSRSRCGGRRHPLLHRIRLQHRPRVVEIQMAPTQVPF